jgi:hypothetical protein
MEVKKEERIAKKQLILPLFDQCHTIGVVNASDISPNIPRVDET